MRFLGTTEPDEAIEQQRDTTDGSSLRRSKLRNHIIGSTLKDDNVFRQRPILSIKFLRKLPMKHMLVALPMWFVANISRIGVSKSWSAVNCNFYSWWKLVTSLSVWCRYVTTSSHITLIQYGTMYILAMNRNPNLKHPAAGGVGGREMVKIRQKTTGFSVMLYRHGVLFTKGVSYVQSSKQHRQPLLTREQSRHRGVACSGSQDVVLLRRSEKR